MDGFSGFDGVDLEADLWYQGLVVSLNEPQDILHYHVGIAGLCDRHELALKPKARTGQSCCMTRRKWWLVCPKDAIVRAHPYGSFNLSNRSKDFVIMAKISSGSDCKAEGSDAREGCGVETDNVLDTNASMVPGVCCAGLGVVHARQAAAASTLQTSLPSFQSKL